MAQSQRAFRAGLLALFPPAGSRVRGLGSEVEGRSGQVAAPRSAPTEPQSLWAAPGDAGAAGGAHGPHRREGGGLPSAT